MAPFPRLLPLAPALALLWSPVLPGATASPDQPTLLPTSPAALKAGLAAFVKASRPNRSVGQPGHAAAFKYLHEQFDRLAADSGGTVRVHAFQPDVDFAAVSYRADFKNLVEGKIPREDPQYNRWKAFTETSVAYVQGFRGREGRNLVLEIRGSKAPDEVLYVGAHYDTTTHNRATMSFTPTRPTDGADDNASGVAAMLAVAAELAASRPERTIRFVAFDYEEVFFLGSYALAKDVAEGKLRWAPLSEKTVGLLNLEMVGWSGKQPSPAVMKLYTRDAADPAVASDLRLALAFESASKRVKASIRPVILQNGFSRSDNWSFWQLKIPAICITEDWENAFNQKNYHTQADTPETLDYGYLSAIARTTAEAARVLSRK